MTFGHSGDIDRGLLEIAGALGRTDDHGAGAVGLQAAVEQPERLGNHARVAVIVHRHRAVAHESLLIELRMFARGHRDRRRPLQRNLVLLDVACRQPGEPLRRDGQSERHVVLGHRKAEGGRQSDRAAASGAAHPGARVGVPSHRNQYVARHAQRHRHRGGLRSPRPEPRRRYCWSRCSAGPGFPGWPPDARPWASASA